jgi:hypothetical protein
MVHGVVREVGVDSLVYANLCEFWLGADRRMDVEEFRTV